MAHHRVECFLSEVREWPKFIEAVQDDEKWLESFNEMAWGLRGLAGSDEGYVIEAFDEILLVIGREDCPIKERLLEVVRITGLVREQATGDRWH